MPLLYYWQMGTLILMIAQKYFLFILIKEGVAMLCGEEENVHKQFQFDNSKQQFSKEKAVTLVIQLVAKRYCCKLFCS